MPSCLLVLLVSLGAIAPAAGQPGFMQVDGWVQWVSGQRLQFVLDNGLSISVDLTRVPQSQYQSLSPGTRDRVTVIGVISQDNRRLVAQSVHRAQNWGDYPWGGVAQPYGQYGRDGQSP